LTDEQKFGKTNIVNSAMVISTINKFRKNVCISLHIPQLSSVSIVQSGNKYPDIPETDFTETPENGLGIVDGDLYYITVPVGSDFHIITNEAKRVIVECNEDGINEINL